MEKRVEFNWLLDFYGPLLTDHRLRVARMYCEEDMSLSEIAQQMGISRQGVHDALAKAYAQLETYESRLGMLERYRRIEAEVERCRSCLEKIRASEQTRPALEEALRALGNIEWIER